MAPSIGYLKNLIGTRTIQVPTPSAFPVEVSQKEEKPPRLRWLFFFGVRQKKSALTGL